jgi:hypothetical protein
MRRIFTNDLAGKVIESAELVSYAGKLVLKLSGGEVYIVSIEHGYYDDTALVDDDMDEQP